MQCFMKHYPPDVPGKWGCRIPCAPLLGDKEFCTDCMHKLDCDEIYENCGEDVFKEINKDEIKC